MVWQEVRQQRQSGTGAPRTAVAHGNTPRVSAQAARGRRRKVKER